MRYIKGLRCLLVCVARLLRGNTNFYLHTCHYYVKVVLYKTRKVLTVHIQSGGCRLMSTRARPLFLSCAPLVLVLKCGLFSQQRRSGVTP